MVPKVPFFLPYTPMVLFFGRLGLCVYVCVSGGGGGGSGSHSIVYNFGIG